MPVMPYSWDRHLQAGKMLSAKLTALRGMIAGCVAATRELKVYMLDAMTNLVIRHPAVEFETWVDDLTVQAYNEDEAVVAITVTAAAEDMRHSMTTYC